MNSNSNSKTLSTMGGSPPRESSGPDAGNIPHSTHRAADSLRTTGPKRGRQAAAATGRLAFLNTAGGAKSGCSSASASNASSQKQAKTNNTPSYLFGGSVNVVDQGGPVPLAYGNVICGSQMIAATIVSSAVIYVAA